MNAQEDRSARAWALTLGDRRTTTLRRLAT
jgi:hypothetical protein